MAVLLVRRDSKSLDNPDFEIDPADSEYHRLTWGRIVMDLPGGDIHGASVLLDMRDISLKVVKEMEIWDSSYQMYADIPLHKNLFRVLGLYEGVPDENHAWVLLPVYNGDTVATLDREVYKGNWHWPETLIWHIFQGVIEGLEALREAGLRHGDLRIRNIFLETDPNKPCIFPRVLLGDFQDATTLAPIGYLPIEESMAWEFGQLANEFWRQILRDDMNYYSKDLNQLLEHFRYDEQTPDHYELKGEHYDWLMTEVYPRIPAIIDSLGQRVMPEPMETYFTRRRAGLETARKRAIVMFSDDIVEYHCRLVPEPTVTQDTRTGDAGSQSAAQGQDAKTSPQIPGAADDEDEQVRENEPGENEDLPKPPIIPREDDTELINYCEGKMMLNEDQEYRRRWPGPLEPLQFHSKAERMDWLMRLSIHNADLYNTAYWTEGQQLRHHAEFCHYLDMAEACDMWRAQALWMNTQVDESNNLYNTGPSPEVEMLDSETTQDF